MKTLEFRRHSLKGQSGMLSPAGIEYARKIGAEQLKGKGFTVVVTTVHLRTSQTVCAFIEGAGDFAIKDHIVEAGLCPLDKAALWNVLFNRSEQSLEALLATDPTFVRAEARSMAEAVKRIVDGLPKDSKVLIVSHGVLTEATVYGLTGQILQPLRECEGCELEVNDGEYRVTNEFRLP